MKIKTLSLLVASLLLNVPVFAQQILSIDIQHRCVYSGAIMDEELYRFDDNGKVLEWVQEITALGGAKQNFELIQTNVENVSAVLDSSKRYLFYSLDFVQKATRIQVYGTLAHEIGHHANKHTFSGQSRIREESEADFFMGYVLSKKNIPKSEIIIFLRSMSSSYGIPPEERLKTVLQGYEKANDALAIKSLQFDNDPNGQELLLPTFTFQQCYTAYNMPREKFTGIKTLAKVDEKIRLVLDQRGYYNRSYFSVKNGFAVVSQMEQYNNGDGSIRNDRTRWLEYPVRDNFAGVLDYLTSVVMPDKGYFRVFVFVVTNATFTASDQKVNKEQATAWLSQGANRLPDALGNLTFSSDYVVSALVYEFEVPQSNRKAKQVCPAPAFDARTHLIKSELGRGFGL